MAVYDSWLTIEARRGAVVAFGSVWTDSWTATHGLSTDNGAIFYMDPDAGPSQSAAIPML